MEGLNKLNKCIKIKHSIRCLHETLSIESGTWITWFRIIVVFLCFLPDSFIVQENVKFHSILSMKMKTEKFSWCSEIAHLIEPWWALLECSGIFRVRSTWLVNTPLVGTVLLCLLWVTYYQPSGPGWTPPPSGQKRGTHPTQSVQSLLPSSKLWCTPHFSSLPFFSAVHHSHINEVDLPQSFPRAEL